MAFTHGLTGYVNNECRCGICKKAHAAYLRAYRQRPEVRAKLRAYQKAYAQRPEVRAHQMAYRQQPEFKAKVRAYQRAYQQRQRALARLAIQHGLDKELG